MYTVEIYFCGGVKETIKEILHDCIDDPEYYDEQTQKNLQKLLKYKQKEKISFNTMKEVAQFVDEIRVLDFSVSLSILDEKVFGLDIDVY